MKDKIEAIFTIIWAHDWLLLTEKTLRSRYTENSNSHLIKKITDLIKEAQKKSTNDK